MTVPYMPRWDTGSNEDPLAALIGKGLQAFGAVKTARQQEADRQQALQRQDAQEQDTANWRDFQAQIDAAKAGFTTRVPDQTFTPTGTTPTGPAGSVIRQPHLATADAPPTPDLTDPKGRAWYRDFQKPGHLTPVGQGEGAFDPVTGKVTPTGFTPSRPPTDHNIDPLSPLGISRSVERDHLSIAAGNKITEKQRADAGDATAMQSAHSDLSAMENTHKGAVAEVARWVASPSVGRLIPGSVGTGIVDIIRQARSAGLSDDAQNYLKRMFDFSSLAGPARYGRRFGSEIALQQIWNDFGGAQLGIGPGGIGATQKNRSNAVRARRTAAGEPAWNEAQHVPTDTGTERPGGPPNQRGHYRPDNPHIPKAP